MDIDALKYFVYIANGNTFTQTAEEYNITQSAVSKAISRLEAEFGLQLIARSNHVMRLTPAGKQLLKDGEILLHDYYALRDNMRDFLKDRTVRVSIVAQNWDSSIHSYIRNFQTKNPDVIIERVTAVSSNMEGVRLLKEHEADFVIMHSGSDEVSRLNSIRKDALCDDKLYVVCPRDHYLAEKDSITLEELQAAKPILCDFSYYIVQELFAAKGMKNTAAISKLRREDLMYDVITRNRVTVYYESNIGLIDKSGIRLIPLEGLSRSLVLASAKGVMQLKSAKEFRQFMINELKGQTL